MVKPDEIWDALMQDQRFRDSIGTPELRDVRRSVINLLPSVLEKFLDKPLSYETLMRARATYSRWLLSTDYLGKQVRAYPKEQTAGHDLDKLEAMVRKEVAETIAKIDATLLIANVDGDREVRGLNAAARAEHKAGTLTLGRLLQLQPTLLFSNDWKRKEHAAN